MDCQGKYSGYHRHLGVDVNEYTECTCKVAKGDIEGLLKSVEVRNFQQQNGS